MPLRLDLPAPLRTNAVANSGDLADMVAGVRTFEFQHLSGRERSDDRMREAWLVARESVEVLAHGLSIADDAPGPGEHVLTLRREPLEAGRAAHDHDAELLLELLEPGGHGRLGHAARFRGATEVVLACEGEHEVQFIDQGRLPEPAKLQDVPGGSYRYVCNRQSRLRPRVSGSM